MKLRRIAGYAVPVVLLGGLVSAQSASAGARPALRAAPPPSIGQLAYVTKSQQVRVASITASGGVSAAHTVGPVTKPTGKEQVEISDLMACGDGSWLAWEENVVKPTKHGTLFIRSVLALRGENGVVDHLRTEQSPIGFAGDTLITTDTATTDRVSVSPTMHLVKFANDPFALIAGPQGVFDDQAVSAPRGPNRTDRLRLITFSHARTVLHSYVLSPTNYRDIDQGWVSGDGQHLVVERGNHQDFGGLGPSSLADDFSLSGGFPRHQLGHVGSAKAQWRIDSISFAGATDQVWGLWDRATAHGVKSLAATYSKGNWRTVKQQAIAVAGNSNGDVIIQPGKWVSIGHDFPDYRTVPTGDPVLVRGAVTKVVKVPGTEFSWLGGSAPA
ncbi:MAG TPA: hypothetical protein VHV79_11815 [Mycobacteriales bacterium]|jgi:hypothetical protein|nr:hypothetical protein [Mycobacteriales bacterium]